MIRATGSVSALQLSIGGTPIAVLDHASLAFTLNGESYTIARQARELAHGPQGGHH
jgi:hypothetical protein